MWICSHKHTMTQQKGNHLIERDNDSLFCCIFAEVAISRHLHLVYHFKTSAHLCRFPHYPLLRRGLWMFLSTPPWLHVDVYFSEATHSVFLVLMPWRCWIKGTYRGTYNSYHLSLQLYTNAFRGYCFFHHTSTKSYLYYLAPNRHSTKKSVVWRAQFPYWTLTSWMKNEGHICISHHCALGTWQMPCPCMHAYRKTQSFMF